MVAAMVARWWWRHPVQAVGCAGMGGREGRAGYGRGGHAGRGHGGRAAPEARVLGGEDVGTAAAARPVARPRLADAHAGAAGRGHAVAGGGTAVPAAAAAVPATFLTVSFLAADVATLAITVPAFLACGIIIFQREDIDPLPV